MLLWQTPWARTTGARKGLFQPTSLSITEGSQGRNSRQELEAGTEAETKEAHCLLCAPSYLSYKAQAHLPRDGSAHSRLPISISNQVNAPQTYLQSFPVEVILWFSFSLLRCDKLTTKLIKLKRSSVYKMTFMRTWAWSTNPTENPGIHIFSFTCGS